MRFPLWGEDCGVGLATVLEDGAVGRSRAKSRDENRRPRCCAPREPVVGGGANSPHAWGRLIVDDATRRSRARGGPRRQRRPQQPGRGPVAGGRDRGIVEGGATPPPPEARAGGPAGQGPRAAPPPAGP